MATIAKSEMLTQLSFKIDEQHQIIQALLKGVSYTTGEKISENTVHTQMHTQKSKLKDLMLIKHILEDNMTDDDINHFLSMTTLVAERETNKAVVHEGDSVLDLIMANPKLNMEKIQKACDKAGLKIVNGVIVR